AAGTQAAARRSWTEADREAAQALRQHFAERAPSGLVLGQDANDRSARTASPSFFSRLTMKPTVSLLSVCCALRKMLPIISNAPVLRLMARSYALCSSKWSFRV